VLTGASAPFAYDRSDTAEFDRTILASAAVRCRSARGVAYTVDGSRIAFMISELGSRDFTKL